MKYKRKYRTGGALGPDDPPRSNFFEDINYLGRFLRGETGNEGLSMSKMRNIHSPRFNGFNGGSNIEGVGRADINTQMTRTRGMYTPPNPPLPKDVQMDIEKKNSASGPVPEFNMDFYSNFTSQDLYRSGQGNTGPVSNSNAYSSRQRTVNEPVKVTEEDDGTQINEPNPNKDKAAQRAQQNLERRTALPGQTPVSNIGDMNEVAPPPEDYTDVDASPVEGNMNSGQAALTPTGAEGSGGSASPTGEALQYIPEALNFLTGTLGKDKTKPATQISNRSVDMMPSTVNVNPQLNQARKAYRAITSDPNVSMNQKLAAQAQLQNQISQIHANKFNRETQLQANKAQLQSQIDRGNATFREQERQDKMASEANLGLTGNFARQALTSASQKYMQNRALEAQMDQADKQLRTIIGAYPEAVQKRILRSMAENG